MARTKGGRVADGRAGGDTGRRVPRESARQQVLDNLRRRIITLELPPGTALSENELAAELGVSRTPIRESLILLRDEGLVQVYPQLGTFVSLVDPARVKDAQFIREAIECSALAEATMPSEGELAATLEDNLRRQDEVAAENGGDEFFELDEQFHYLLLRLAGRESAWSTVTSAKAHLDRARRLSLVDTRPLPTLVAQHRAVIDQLRAGDTTEAIARLRTHLRAVFDDVEVIRRTRPELFSDAATARPTRRTVTELT